MFHTDSINFLSNKSSTPTPNSLDIFASVSISGCEELVHHLETVEGFTPPPMLQITICWFSSVLRAQFLGDLRLAYLSDLLLGCKDSENVSFCNIIELFLEFFMNMRYTKGYILPIIACNTTNKFHRRV